MFLFLWLLVAATAEDPISRGYYDLQVQGSLSPTILRRLSRVLGYEPNDFLPPNGLRVWIESAEKGTALTDVMQHLRSITRLETGAAHRDDIAASVNNLRTQYRRSAPMRANASLVTDSGRPVVLAGSADWEAMEDDDDNDGTKRFKSLAADSFERFSSGELTVRLRVVAYNSSMDELLQIAQPVSRTRVAAAEEHASHYVLADVHCDDAARVADELMRDKRIGWVELQVPYHPLNKFATATVRSGINLQPVQLPAGLDGTGQVLAISDTGLETNNCFFYDPSGVKVPTIATQSVPVDTQHRKVRAYWSGAGGDFRDIGSEAAGAGHGTHVCGSAVGSAPAGDKVAPFNGGAPKARLAMIDLLSGNSRNGFLSIPVDLGSTIMKWAYDVGARVHSGSWGGDAGGRYTADEQSLDLFAYKNRNFLIIFAAGNEGPRSASISSPGNAKNVLAVGATMNGVDSVEIAQKPSRAAIDYTPEWLSPFSSRGARTMSLRKPDVVAPGGPYVWSAGADSTTLGTCTSFAAVTTGLYGTSMATPHVAAAAIQLRQYFVDKKYPNSARVAAEIDTREPTASLLRALLVASAQPLLGVYPRQPFVTGQDRIDASGHGRVALGAVLDSRYIQLAVLNNENERYGLQKQRQWRWCVEVVGANGASLADGFDYGQVVVAMSYADYPSTPTQGGRALLVNDLRLQVLEWETEREYRVNDQEAPETRSTNEKVVVGGGVSRFSVVVSAPTLGFGDAQTFSLVLVLQRAVGSEGVVLRVSKEPSSVANNKCTLCETTGVYSFNNDCATCGNGIVEAPMELCDSTVCCDSAACVPLNDQSQCVVEASDCKLRGRCVQGSCVVDNATRYGVGASGVCEALPALATPSKCVARSVASWRASLAQKPAERAVIDHNGWTLCCAPLWAAIEMVGAESLGTDLTREYVAAQLNVLQTGAASSAELLLAIQETKELLEDNCGTGLLGVKARRDGDILLDILQTYNQKCDNNTAPASRCEGNSADVVRLNALVCSSGGVYDRATGKCACHSNRQPGESNCANLACSGNGASVFDQATDRDICVCLDGWTGATCAQCSVPTANGVVRHCLGVPTVLRSTATAPQRVPVLVDKSTVLTRMNGRYYGRFASAKLADGKPGVDGLDCWCRTTAERVDWKSYDTHAAALAASIEQRAQLDIYTTRALSILAGQVVTLDTEEDTAAVILQLSHLSSGSKIECEVALFVLALVLSLRW